MNEPKHLPEETNDARRFALEGLLVETDCGRIRGPGGSEQVDPKVMEVLQVLLAADGGVVTRAELLDRVWPDRVVTEDVVSRCIYQLRRHLVRAGGDRRFRRLIETLPRRGYRLRGRPHPPEGAAEAGHRKGPSVLRAALVVVLLAVVAAWWLQSRGPTPSGEALPEADTALVVLPFADLSEDGDKGYLADGITEELINVLARLRGLRVIARTSAFSYKGQFPDIPTVASDLNVTHVLEGSVRSSGNRLRVTAQLIDASNSSHLWSETFEREMGDIFAIQSEIANIVNRELRAVLPGNGEELVVRPTEDVEAYELYLRGQFLFANYYQLSGADSIIRSLDYYQQALERDPEFAQAWASLGSAYALAMLLPEAAGRIDDPAARTRAAVERALALEPDNAMAHSALAAMHMARMEWADAERSLVRANEADMQLVNSRVRYGYLLVCMGRSAEALDILLEAAALDPVNAIAAHWLADAYRNLGQMEESLAYARRTVDLAPTAGMEIGVYLYHLLAGDFEQAVAFQESISVDRGIDPAWVRPLVEAVRDPERIPAAVETLASIAEAHPTLHPIHYYFDLNDPGLIFDTVDEMAEDTPFLFFLWRFWEPQLAHLRSHPRFHALAERIGMVDYWREMGWPELCRPAGDGFVCD